MAVLLVAIFGNMTTGQNMRAGIIDPRTSRQNRPGFIRYYRKRLKRFRCGSCTIGGKDMKMIDKIQDLLSMAERMEENQQYVDFVDNILPQKLEEILKDVINIQDILGKNWSDY